MPSATRVAHRYLRRATDATQTLKQVGEHFKRKYGLTYDISPRGNAMGDGPEVAVWDDSDEPLYRATLSVEVNDVEDGDWGIHVSQGNKTYGFTLDADASLRDIIAEAERAAKRESDLLRVASKTAKQQDDAALVKAIEGVLGQIRKDAGDERYDPVADVDIWTGPKIRRWDPRSRADVVLTYDGAGYDYLSPQADYPSVSRKYRTMLEKAARRLGYYMEDVNSWSAGFYYEG